MINFKEVPVENLDSWSSEKRINWLSFNFKWETAEILSTPKLDSNSLFESTRVTLMWAEDTLVMSD